jgi:hypothetical protein
VRFGAATAAWTSEPSGAKTVTNASTPRDARSMMKQLECHDLILSGLSQASKLFNEFYVAVSYKRLHRKSWI